MATSWAQETQEKVNYTKLCRLLYDGGTLAVKTVFDGIVLPASLGVALATNKHTLQRLKRPTGRVLSQDQWHQLYPPSGAVPKSEDFDITLLFVLLRNICGVTRPATGWDALPAPTDASLEANLVKIKYYRNKVTAHSSKAEVDDTQFETYWKDISSALVVLGLKQNDIDELKSSPLGEKKYNQLVESWYLSDEDIKQHLEAIESNTTHIKMTSAKVESNTAEIKSDTVEIKSKVCSIESKLQNTHLESEVDKLAHINYTSLIENNYCRKYHPSTREWVLQQVEEYIKTTASEAGAVVIRAGPGMGKSIIAAKICEIYKNNGLLGGCHFFQHSNSLRNNPRIMLQSIARQLCNTVPRYQSALEATLKTLQGRNISDLKCEELFGMLFEEPLGQIHMDHNVVIVIDALDECASQYKEEIEDVLESKLCNLPSWIRFVITTRPLPSCCNLNPADLIEIIESDQRNVQDLITYLEFELVQRNARDLTNKFVSISSGLFLVAYFLLNILDESGKESILNADCFPHGISSVYKHYFKRIHNLLKPYIETSQPQDSFYQMLKAVVASKRPIPKEIFYEILHLKSVDDISPEKKKERNDAVHLLHTIFPVENDHVTVFHKTVTDWLTHNADNQHQFSVSVNSGLEVLVEKTLDVLEGYKKRPHPLDQPLVLSNNEKFAVLFGVDYMTNVCREGESKMDEIIKNLTVAAAIASLKELLVNYSLAFPKPVKPFLNRLFQYRFSDNTAIELYMREKNICFGLWLSVAGDLLLNCKCSPLSSPEKEELRHWLVENKVPHYSVHCVASGLPLSMQEYVSLAQNLGLLKIRNGIIAVSNRYTLHCFHIKDDGSIGDKRALGNFCMVRGVSPDKRHLIITKLFQGCVELYDVTTLEKVQKYNCPMDRVESCHTFGDAQQWYIVVKAEGDPNIYILDGLNGDLVDAFKVPRDIDEIITVSQTGHILMGSKVDIGPLEPIVFNRYLLVCKVCFGVTFYSRKLYFDKICDKTNDPEEGDSFKSQGDCCRFSDDAKHFAMYCSNSTVYVFRTKYGTLYRKFYFVCSNCKIIFLSSSCLIIRYNVTTETMLFGFNEPSQLAFFDLVRNKLIYCTSASIWYCCEPLVVPHQDASTNTFFPALYGLIGKDLVKLKFHCLEQNYLDSS